MTSVFGTDSSYYGIANDHLYLNVTDDYSREAKTCYSSLINHQASDEDITAYTQKYNSKWNPSIFKAIQSYESDCNNNLKTSYQPIQKSSMKTTIYSVMKEIPTLSECLKYVEESEYQNVLTQQRKTFFAFENSGSEIAYKFCEKYNFQKYVIRELLKANTLDYKVNPTQIVKRKVQLQTMSESNYIFADGRGQQLVVYIPNTNFNYYSIPSQEVTLLVKGYLETDNGWLYIIEAPIIPKIIL